VVIDSERAVIIVASWGRELEIVGGGIILHHITELGAIKEVFCLDTPLQGAHVLTHLLVEVLDNDIEVPEEEWSPARLVLDNDLAILVVRQDRVQVCHVVCAALVLWCHLDRVMDNLAINCGLND